MSLLTRKGKRWPELSKNTQRHSHQSSVSQFQQSSHITLREPNLATNLFSITGMQGERTKDQHVNYVYDKNDVIKADLPHSEHHRIRHHRRKNGRRHVLQEQLSFETTTVTFEREEYDESNESNNNQQRRGSLSNNPIDDNHDGDLRHEGDGVTGRTENEIENDIPTVAPSNETSTLPRRCQGEDAEKDSNCTGRYQFPSSVLMIEAHYNQTVRDFLQICTPVERVEIESVDDIQILLNALYQQMSTKEVKIPSSIVLLFNLEHYTNWTKEKVIDVLQATVNVLHNDFNDMMIYSKFHQDGADSNDTHLSLTYDVKYWLSDLCNQRLTPCADFASIILESVLQINDIENNGNSNSTYTPEVIDSLDDASTQANAYVKVYTLIL